MVTAFVMILNETVLSVALPVLMQELSITAVTAQWLSTGFMLTMAVVIPTTGYLLNRLSTRAVFTVALSLFLPGTALCAAAPGVELLLAGRIVQAGGTAMVLPLLMTTTLTLVPFQRRGAVMGLSSVVISAAPALGPTLSGIILDAFTWRFLFILMLPVVAAAFVAGLVLDGSDPLWPVALFTLGLVALTLFVLCQTRMERRGSALLNLRPLSVPTFRTSVLIVVVAMMTMLGTVVVLPLYLIASLGLSTLQVGLVLLPGGLVQGVLSPFVGRAFDRVGPRTLVVSGAGPMALALWLQVALLDAASAPGLVVGLHVVFGVGLSLVMTPLMTLALGSLPRELYADGSAIMNTLQQLAGAASTALFVALLTVGSASAHESGAAVGPATAQGMLWAFAFGGVLAVLAVVASWTLRPLPRPASA